MAKTDLIWHGTASIEAICDGGRILFDPFVPLKGSPVDVRAEEFDGFSHIFVTHGHLDHTASLPGIVKRNPAVTICCTRAVCRTLRRKGVPAKNLSLLRYGETRRVNGFTVRVYHAKHAVLPKLDRKRLDSWLRSPARGNIPYILWAHMLCPEKGESVLYQFEADGKTVALLGSLNLRDDVGYPVGADVLVLPYNGWDDNLPPAVKTIQRLKPKRVLLDHYDDTFPPLTSTMDVSPLVERYGGLAAPMVLGKKEPV